MTAERDTERIVRSWLDVGVTRLPDHILDAVLDQVPATPQRRAWWPTWRFAQMPTTLKLALGAAAIVLVAVAGFAMLPRNGSIGGPGPTPTPSPTPTPIALSATNVGKVLSAGRYRFAEPFSQPMTLTVPGGWTLDQITTGMVKFVSASGGEFDAIRVDSVPIDPCHSDRGNQSPAPATAADLAAAFRGLAGFDAGPVESTTVGGRPTQHFTISNSIDTATAACTGTVDSRQLTLFHVVDGDSPYTNGGTAQEIWVVDVDGTALLLLTDPSLERMTSDVKADIESIVSSIAFE